MDLALGFWAAEHLSPPVCQLATSIHSVKYDYTYAGKSFCWHTGGNDILKNVFGFLYILM